MLVPTGFWSYTTSDEVNSRGKLSQLRALLAAELQQQVGRSPKVNIFQDVAAIPPGREWERQIHEAIAESSFLIPIITPAFLQSEWCCHEIDLFRKREGGLGASELVFPIHYVDTDETDDDSLGTCHDPAALAFLRTRQWTDLRGLRFRNQEGEEVALVLERLARGILAALRRADQPAMAPRRPDRVPQRGARAADDPMASAASTPGSAASTIGPIAMERGQASAAPPTSTTAQASTAPVAGAGAKPAAKPKTAGQVIGNGVLCTIFGALIVGGVSALPFRLFDFLLGTDIGGRGMGVVAALTFVALAIFFIVDGAKELRRTS